MKQFTMQDVDTSSYDKMSETRLEYRIMILMQMGYTREEALIKILKKLKP